MSGANSNPGSPSNLHAATTSSNGGVSDGFTETPGHGRRPSLLKKLSANSSGKLLGNASPATSTLNASTNPGSPNSTMKIKPSSSPKSTSAANTPNQHKPQLHLQARSKSRMSVLTGSSNTYVAREKAYLRKIRNQMVDDYYTKGITGANELREELNDEDEDDEDLQPNNNELLGDIDDDNYQIDFNIAFSDLKLGDTTINPNKNITQLSKDNVDDPNVLERLEWQSMLTSVLTGDVVKSEKTKINNNNPENSQDSLLLAVYKENLWYGIRAKLLNRTVEDQKRIIQYRRTLVDSLISDISKFEINYESIETNHPRSQVESILDRWEAACGLWRTLEELKTEKPACREEDFCNRIDALNAWLSITSAIARETNSLKTWIGNDELDITKSNNDTKSISEGEEGPEVKQIFDEDNKSLAERLMKEKDVQSIFRKRVFNPITPWMIKSKDTYIKLGHYFELMKLPDYIHDLIRICIIPMKLIKEIINVRLGYAMKLQNPTLMMIDQMIDDFKSYISIALEVKLGIQEYCKPDAAKTWILGDLFEGENLDFDQVVLRCVKYYFVLLNRKLLDSSRSPTNFRTFKEPEELEEAWNYLKTLGNFIEGGSVVVAEKITLLTLKLIHRLMAYFNNQIRNPQAKAGVSDLIRWYSSTTENFGQLRRKLARFTGEISRDFTNSLVFVLPTAPNNRTKMLLDILKATNHFLVYTGTVEAHGTYFFASSELMGNDQEILKIINGSYVGLDPHDAKTEFSDLLKMIKTEKEREEDEFMERSPFPSYSNSFSYVLALCPPKPIVWEGNVVSLDISEVPITDVKVGQMLLITKLPYYSLHIVKEKFLGMISDVMVVGGIMSPVEQRCSLARVHHELTKINRMFFRMSLAVLDSVKIVRNKCKEISPDGVHQGLTNSFFVYAKDFGKSSVRNLDSTRKSTVIMKLIQLSIEWVSFICDDCNPTDRKTFRWCVQALEFAMDMTRGFNVLVLNDDQFYQLKLKVARCMSLLISHFDIMGARSSEAEKKNLIKWTSLRHKIERTEDDEYILKLYGEDVMRQIDQIEEHRHGLQEQLQSVGKVIDVSDLEYQFVTLLASSFSSVSIRWQKGRFIGGGTFGSVYAAVDLDTGAVMAVKEIRFHDSQSIKNIVSSIKEEMTVLEMLNHPNVVQYYGVEVHRDKVYIFMEFCEGGSLAGLLSYGRIEDELVIQIYTLQMLEGLAYLHQSGIVHKDIKPENILLDHNGVVKFVDFGTAKVIGTSGRTRAPGTVVGNGPNNLNSMTGTPMYMSPEVITGESISRTGVVDIWSLGCCILEMATGRRPWANLDNEWAIMYHIAAGHKPQLPTPDQLSEAGIKFVARCLEHDPRKRPSAAELLNDPWMVSIRQTAFGSGDSSSTPTSEINMEVPG